MHVLIAPDCFSSTLTAVEAADAMASGWREQCPNDVVKTRGVSDGGPGFVDVVADALSADVKKASVTGPLGEDISVRFAMIGDTAYLEAAQACGLELLGEDERDPGQTTTFGVGQMVLAAMRAGATTIVLGLGGSGTNDGGAGMLAALGATADGALDTGGRPLRRLTQVDVAPAREAVAGVKLIAASDVDNPLLGLRGCSRNYAPQKGASEDDVMQLEAALENFAKLVGRQPNGKDPAVALGSGAAGGLGYGLALLGAERVPGIATVMDIVGLDDLVAEADVVITGEGRFDWQSLRGKVVSGVAGMALAQAKPAIVIAGEVAVGRREYSAIGVAAAYGVSDVVGSIAESMAQPAETLTATAARVARTWSKSGDSTA